jgi:hypothetical protein
MLEYLFDQFILGAGLSEVSRPTKLKGNAVHVDLKVFAGPTGTFSTGVKLEVEFSNDLDKWTAHATTFDTGTQLAPVRIFGQCTSAALTASGQNTSALGAYEWVRVRVTNQWSGATVVTAGVSFFDLGT